jgi:hypothetical protein
LRSFFKALLAIFGATLVAICPVAAAELRVSFAELASVVQKVVGDGKIYLNNAPGGLLQLVGTSSSVTLGNQLLPVPVPVKSFQILGSSYAYYINDVTSTAIRVSPVSGALRLTVEFESEGPELVGGCISGGCGLAGVLPDIEWGRPQVHIDLFPVRFNGSVSLQVRSVEIGGSLEPVCRSSSGVIAQSTCQIARPAAQRTIQTVRKDLNAILKERVNDPSIQQSLADSLKRYLVLGPAGEVAITNVSVDSKGVVVAFQFGAGG